METRMDGSGAKGESTATEGERESGMSFPCRGSISTGGEYYTDWNGVVYKKDDRSRPCCECALGIAWSKGTTGCPEVMDCRGRRWNSCSKVEGAYVMWMEEAEACEIARHAIEMCYMRQGSVGGCKFCALHITQTCTFRKFLEKKVQPDAWNL